MSLFGRKPKRPPASDLPDRLRSAALRLRGWTVTGNGLDLDRLLHEAADAIEALYRPDYPQGQAGGDQ